MLTALLDSLIAAVPVGGESAVDKLFVSALDSGNRSNWFFEQRLQRWWQPRAAETYLSGYTGQRDGADETRWLIEFKPLQTSVTYRDGAGAGNWRRGAKVALYLTLLEMPARRVLWSGELRGNAADIIARDEAASLENRTVDFTVGRVRSRRVPGRLLPSLLVTAAAGSIVYLFYSVRSR